MIRVSEMGVAELGGAEGLQDGSQGVSHQTATSRTWMEAHILRLTTPKGNFDRASNIIRLATGLWKQTSISNQDRSMRGRLGGEDEDWRRLEYDGGVGGHGSASEWRGKDGGSPVLTRDVRGYWSGLHCWSKSQKLRRRTWAQSAGVSLAGRYQP